MFSKPRSVRNRSISSSGFTPGSSRRNTLRISSSSKTIDVFDCSLVIRRALVSSVPSDAKPSTARNSRIPSPPRDHRTRAHHVHELARVARVLERVELLAAREQLVRLVRAGVEADLDELDVQLRLALVQRHAVEHARVHDLARLRREPAPRR